jgi:Fic family protein
LSLDEVKGVIDGKTVIGQQKEIQEVKNAYRAYEEIGTLDPYSLEDLKRVHGIMTYLTVADRTFRQGGESVFVE